MKQRKCPYSKHNNCYDYGNCEDCEWCKLIEKYEHKIKRLKSAVKKYEDKIENGEIIFAPKYKLKQIVYVVVDKNTYFRGQIDMFDFYTQKYSVFIDEYYDNNDELGFGNEWYYENELLATEAEAEARLKELQEKKQ